MHYTRWRTTGTTDKASRDRGGYVNEDGYRVRHRDGKPILEHRLVMEQIIGRPLTRIENVHHRNGVRHDNRPENLELWTSSQPPRQNVADLVAWARQVLAEYGDIASHLPSSKKE